MHASRIGWLVGACAIAVAPCSQAADAPLPTGPVGAIVDFEVLPGDTLIGLSSAVFTSPAAWREIAALNRLANPNRIRPGLVLRVPARLLRSQAAAATLVSVEGEVKVDDAAAAAGSLLREGQSISTGERGSVVIELADGSRVKLPPSSLAELMTSRNMASRGDAPAGGLFSGMLRLLRGSVEVFATKVLRARPLELTTPTAVIGVRGTQFRAGADADPAAADQPSSRVEVLEGRVQVERLRNAAAAAGVELPQGFAARVDAGSGAIVAAPLLPAPDLSGVPARFERPMVRFAPPGIAEPLRVQVAADAAFDRIVSDQLVPLGTDVRVAGLADGNWFLRARRQDARGLEGYDAERPFVLKARPEPPPVSTPPPRAKQTVGAVPFGWAASVQALQYRLQVARDAAFADLLLDRADVAGNALQLDIGAAGVYHWRVASIAAGNDQGPFGDPQSFELRELPTAPEGGVSADGRSVALRWGGRPQDRQQVELASDEAFTNIVARAELSEPAWALPVPSQTGTYYFRYRSVEPDGFVTPYSSTLKIEVPFDKRWLLLLAPLLLLGF